MTAKSPSGRLLFMNERDRRTYLGLLGEVARARGWGVFTYCLMSNHLHMLVRTREPGLGAGFKQIHEEFAAHVNRSRAEHGHVFGSRFHNKLVLSDHHFVACLRYIARNPVEAGLCQSASQWPWSAHRALAGLAEQPEFLDVEAALELLNRDPAVARADYQRLVARSNAELLQDMRQPHSDSWLIPVVDEYGVPPREIAHELGISLATLYRRLANARENEGTVP